MARAEEYLKKHYVRRAGGKVDNIAVRKEAWMRSLTSPRGIGFGRADLLLSFRETGRATPRCIIVEAKSHKTLRALNADPGCGLMFLSMMGAGAVSFGLVLHWAATLGWFRYLLAFPAFWVGFFVSAQLVYASRHLSSMGVVDQVKKYPAHERWIAVPNDMLGDDYNRDELHELATRDNIGVLVFARKAGTDPVEILMPRERDADVDFLAQYASAKKVLKVLPPT